ncbi:MAG TPA: hypothetical protein VMX76_03245, partial [Nevskiaceae bacterium]|nr:hypothetical protein [Nevskiaceae bacterium]
MIINILKFFFFIFFFCFVPGRLVVSFLKINFSKPERMFISLALGIVILTTLSFFLAWVGLRFLLFPLLILAGFYLVLAKKWRPKIVWRKKIDWLVVLIIVLATIFQNLVMIKSGLDYQGGIAFWGVHGHDGLWHLTLIQELAENFPAQNPAFAGETVKNYHYFFDLFGAEIYRLTRISIIDLYFRFLPLFLTLTLNSLIFLFAKRWSNKKEVGLLAIFLTSFASSFGFLLPFFGIGSSTWETAFWAMQPAFSFQNPPFAISLLILTLGMYLLLFFQKKQTKWLFLVLTLVFGVLVEFKVYGGILSLFSLGVMGVFYVIKDKNFKFLKLSLAGLALAALLYLPQNTAGFGFVQWQPFWFIRTMIQAPDRVNWVALELRRQTYLAVGDWLTVLVIDFVSLIIFLVGNLGVRILAIVWLVKRIRKISLVELFLGCIFLTGLVLPLFFVQKFVVWNTIQFFYYSIFVASFFAAWGISNLLAKFGKLKFLALFLLVLLSLPGSLKTISWYVSAVPTAILDRSEKSALEFLRNLPPFGEDIILVYPHVAGAEKLPPPVPLSHYNTAY